ncbi:hypothetical protein ACWGII_33410 [Streptomyces sp. NPDC054855]
MKITKAAAGLLGAGLALGTASAACAAPQPPADGGTLLDSVTRVAPGPDDVHNPLDEVAVDPATGELRANNPSAVTSTVDGAAQGAVSLLGGLPAAAPLGG